MRSAGAQRDAIDRFAGEELAQVHGRYLEVYRRWQAGQRELGLLVAETDRRAREAEELRLALAEIESVDPHRGEDTELSERAKKLTNLEDLRLAAAGAHELLSADDSDAAMFWLLGQPRRQLEHAADHDPELFGIAEAVAEASFAGIHRPAGSLSYLSGLDTDGARELELVQDRRAELAGLARKYGGLDAAIDQLEQGSGRLFELDSASDRIASLGAEVEADHERWRRSPAGSASCAEPQAAAWRTGHRGARRPRHAQRRPVRGGHGRAGLLAGRSGRCGGSAAPASGGRAEAVGARRIRR